MEIGPKFNATLLRKNKICFPAPSSKNQWLRQFQSKVSLAMAVYIYIDNE